MPIDGDRLTGADYSAEERAADPYIVSLVTTVRAGRNARQSENMSIVCDELASTAVRRRTQLLNPRG